MLKIPTGIKRDTCNHNSRPFLAKYLRASLLDVSAVICQRTLVDESEMIGTQMGRHNRSENGRNAREALYDVTP
jgi:hypothetical protein